MPLREDYLRVKGRLKRGLGISSGNTSSTSAGKEMRPSRSPSPVPDTIPQPQSQSQNSNDTRNLTSGTTLLPPDPPSFTLADPIAATLPALTISAPSAVSKGNQAPRPVTPRMANNEKTETIFERTKAVAWSGLKTLLQMVESNSGVFPPLGSAVSGLNRFIEIFEATTQGRKEFEELITTLCSLLEDTGGYVSRAGPGMTNSVKNLWIGLDKELKIVEGKYDRGEIQRLAEALEDPEEIADCHRRIHAHLQRLALNANLSTWETVNESVMEARLRGLSPALSAMYNSSESEKVKRRECTPGTREKELEKLLRWARNKSSEAEDVYWMNGMAGTGKTTIACSLCAELEKSSELGASFFCSRLLPECRDVGRIIPCIAYQLARFSIPFYHELSNVLKDDPDICARVLRTQFERLLINPLNQVRNTLPTDFVIVIDALDECDSEDSVGQILDLLLSHTPNLDLPARFLISSRPESKIYQKMMARAGHSFEARLILHDLDAEAVKLDIQTYLEAELAVIDITSTQLTQLVELSGVLFIFATTTARYIVEGLEFMDVEERLAMVLGLSTTPTSHKNEAVDQLYTSILQSVLQKKSISTQIWKRLKMMLDAVTCAKEPLTTEGLAGLLGEKSGTHVEVLLRQLSSVLNIDASTGLITTLHTSFADYMLTSERSLSFHCNPTNTHTMLSRACFEAVMNGQHPQFNICVLESSYRFDADDPGLNERTSKLVSSHMFYACRYWVAHLELSDSPDKSGGLLWDFLSKWLLLWMEVLNVKKCTHLGPNIMQRAERWSKTNACSEKTTQLAHDAWRFVTMFAGYVVSQSTSHIYLSMLPFWPPSSPISTHYFPQKHGGIQLQGTAVTRRQLGLLATWMFNDVVYAVSFSPDGSLIAVGISSSVYIIDSITGRTILAPLAHNGLVRATAFSCDGLLLATGSEDHCIRMWGTTNGDIVWEAFEAHTAYVISLSFFPSGTRLVSGGGDCSLRVWATDTGDAILGPIVGHTSAIISVSVSPDGTRIASASADRTIRVWNAQTGDMTLGPLKGHTARINSVCFSPDGLQLVSGSWDSTVRVWSNLSGPATVESLQEHTDQVESVAFSPDGKYIVSGSKDSTIRLWTGGPDLGCVTLHRGHTDSVHSVAFSHDSSRVVSGSHDKTVRVWDARVHDEASSLLDGHSNFVSSVSFSPDGRRILSSSDDETMCVWDAQSGKLAVGPFRGHTTWVRSACFSPDGTQVVSSSADRTVRWWDAYNGSAVGEAAAGHTEDIWSVCFSPDGTLVASSSDDRTIRLWDAHTHKLVGSPLEGHKDCVRSVCFAPDGSRLVSGSKDQTVMVWDVESRRQVLSPLHGHTWGIASVHVSPDGTRIVSGSWDRTVRLWNAHTGEPSLSPLRGHTGDIIDVRFSHNGRYVVSCSIDKSLRIWNAQTGEVVGNPLLGHTEEINSCRFSPCDRWIVSGSSDSVIRVWDVADLVEGQGSKAETHQHGVQSSNQSPSLHFSWHPQYDGWVVDAHNRLLAWVPPDLRHALMFPRNTLLISTGGSFQIEFNPAKLGEKWTDSYAT